MDIAEAIESGEALLDYAFRQKIAIAPADVQLLRSARGQEAVLAAPGAARDAFLAALGAAAAAVPVSVADLRTSHERQKRLKPLVNDAWALLGYAASNGRKVDDENRKLLIEKADVVERGAPAVADEQGFFKAYEQLAMATSPVTAETLVASATVLPTLRSFFSSRDEFWKGFEHLTLGRFVDATVFVVVLLLAGFSLGYQSVGSEGLSRLSAVKRDISVLSVDIATNTDALTMRKQTWDNAKSPEQLEAAQKAVLETSRALATAREQLKELQAERQALPGMLWKWAQEPCRSPITSWALCSSVHEVPKGGAAPSALAQEQAAATTVRWLNEIVLPLLLGWLGAYAFVIRRMTADIAQRSFGKSSTLRHVTRLALGALAGIASGWLLPAGAVSAELKNVPAWVLAFVAGYGIELVFAFLDRIIGAFTTKTP